MNRLLLESFPDLQLSVEKKNARLIYENILFQYVDILILRQVS
jgi:hypothetical protein